MNKEISIGDLVNLILNQIGVSLEVVTSKERIRPGKSEVDRLVCDNSKLIDKTNWKPEFSLELGIKNVINWMNDSKNPIFYKADKYNV